MKVTEDVWLERMNNLNERRKVEVIKNSVPGVDNYSAHIRKAIGGIGDIVLDIGCGSCGLKNCLPPETVYVGIDPFPMVPGVEKMKIEECRYGDGYFDTVYMFAALDNVIDFKKAIEQIKRVCHKNVLFLSGVNIPPDKYHTIEITEEALTEEMKPFSVGYKEYLHPKILLIEFIR